jgi:hypothetical protein
MKEERKLHLGGCACGHVRYHVSGPSVWCAGCCCRSCTLNHGAPYVVWAGFERSAFAFIGGDRTKSFRSSAPVIRRFCPECGTALTYEKDAGVDPAYEAAENIVYIAVSTLDDPSVYPPTEVVRASERANWLDLGMSIPLRDVLSPTAAHLQSRE